VTDDPPQSEEGCPDGGACHHRCLVGCWRVVHAEPLGAAGYPYGNWPTSTRRAYGNVVQAGAATISGAFDTAVAALDSSPGDGADNPEPDNLGDSATAPEPGEDQAPIIDLTDLLARMDGTIRGMRATAVMVERWADDLTQLREALNGDT
jgi:hypothetical protein